jgi:hypothetical protein
MSKALDAHTLDYELRRLIYDDLIERGIMPAADQLAERLAQPVSAVRASFWRLKDGHILVLQEGDREVLMANPFSAVPTPFVVRVGSRSWWGNCIWDALGIAAMVGEGAVITTACGDCNDAMQVGIEGGSVSGEGIVHFSVPAARWWDNIKFT